VGAVFDLARGNGAGYALKLGDIVPPPGLYCRLAGDGVQYLVAHRLRRYIVSAAELFAAVMRDEYGAVLIGTTTYGKAVMQNTYEFSDGSALTLSVGRIYTKSGTWNDTGLKPDYSVELTAGTTPDAVDDDWRSSRPVSRPSK